MARITSVREWLSYVLWIVRVQITVAIVTGILFTLAVFVWARPGMAGACFVSMIVGYRLSDITHAVKRLFRESYSSRSAPPTGTVAHN